MKHERVLPFHYLRVVIIILYFLFVFIYLNDHKLACSLYNAFLVVIKKFTCMI